MVSFESDYNNGASEAVLKALVDSNGEQTSSYGADRFSESARDKIRTACQTPDADIYFLVGGTQTNATVIGTVLRPYEGVIAVRSGHIAVHEAGAVEFSGHKVLQMDGRTSTVESSSSQAAWMNADAGKMQAEELDRFASEIENEPSRDHCVFAGMVYITFPTEYGTIYSSAEISDIYDVCRKHGLKLYIDGARLGYGLEAEGNDVTLPFLASHCDCFYIGGTKVGALCGEAVVFPRNNAPEHFFTMVKQRGALLAKSRVAGVQFDALFTDGLYFRISRHAIAQAMKIKDLFKQHHIPLAIDSPTNQQFVILDDSYAAGLVDAGILFEKWEQLPDGRSVYRFVTSWATKDGDIALLESALTAR